MGSGKYGTWDSHRARISCNASKPWKVLTDATPHATSDDFAGSAFWAGGQRLEDPSDLEKYLRDCASKDEKCLRVHVCRNQSDSNWNLWNATKGQFAKVGNSYKKRDAKKVKECSLDDLKDEIAKKRAEAEKGVAWHASKRNSAEYKSEIAKIARSRSGLPEHPTPDEQQSHRFPPNPVDVWIEKVICAYPERFWIEGCAAPTPILVSITGRM